MMIAHAAEQMGCTFQMVAPKRKSHISGAQYLHSDVGIRVEGISPTKLHYVRRGDERVYQRKVYPHGLPADKRTSWSKFPGEVEAWPLRAIYDHLWNRYESLIEDAALTMAQLAVIADHEDTLVFNTAPLNTMGVQKGLWHERVWIVDEICFAEPETIVYNGLMHTDWYRSSNLWGHMSTELPDRAYPPAWTNSFRVLHVTKPLYTTYEAPPGVILSGRYGRWEKGVLVDESYFQALDAIKARL